MRRKAGMVVFLMALAGTVSCVPWTIRPIESEKESSTNPSAVTDPVAYVDSIWETDLMPRIGEMAADARMVLDALATSPKDAIARYGQKTVNGPTYFLLQGTGMVLAIETRSRSGLALVDIAPFDRQADLSIQIGPVLQGTSLRDATGLVPFTLFTNQLEFADVGNELNRHVLKTVLAALDREKLTGHKVSFLGTLVAEPDAHPPLREMVPVRLTVEEGR